MGAKERIQQFIQYKGLNNKAFEVACGLGNGFVSKIGDSIRKEKLEKISLAFPELNIDWIINEKGEMLKPSVSQNAVGDNNTQVAGNGNNVNVAATALMEELSAQRKLTEKAQEQVTKSQEQIDRLLSIIEKMK